MVCKHYNFLNHRCIIYDSFCTHGYPEELKHCSNNKFEQLWLPEGISELYDS